jgi:hypothetical protein
VYIPPEVVTAGPLVETPATIDVIEGAVLFPPVIGTEDSDELTEYKIEPEFVTSKVGPKEPKEPVEDKEAVVALLSVFTGAPVIVLPDILSDDDDLVFVPEELNDASVEPEAVPPEFSNEGPNELTEDTVEDV